MLYPLKFVPIYKEKIWGGNRISKLKGDENNKNIPENNCGESWEISAVQGDISVVANGFLEGNNLQEVIEIYMGDLVGDENYKKFGIELPLLFKFIDANSLLSVQVHPNNELAKKRHKAYGKNEMWYILEAEKNAELILGFKDKISKYELKNILEARNTESLNKILNTEKIKKDEVYYIPAGRVHAIGSGILLAEIQQTSDITYRLHDWNRTDKDGKHRDLHITESLDAIDFQIKDQYKTEYQSEKNKSVELKNCLYFKTNLLDINTKITKDYTLLDSFVVFMAMDGNCEIIYNQEDEKINLNKGETILIPACLEKINISPNENCKLLEIYI